jgi:hypothetical protein
MSSLLFAAATATQNRSPGVSSAAFALPTADEVIE